MIFIDEQHKTRYFKLLNQMKEQDSYHRSAAYLMALADLHTEDVFDFKKDCIKREGLQKNWQCSSSLKATRLMFNLWNGCTSDEIGNDKNVSCYAVDAIFSNYSYAPYFLESIRIQYELI